MARPKNPQVGAPNVETRAARTTAKAIFPFLQLPAELRNRIYFFVLDNPNPIYLNVRSPTYHVHSSRNAMSGKASPLSLLLINKQVCSEVFPVLLATRNFVVTNTPFEPDLNVSEVLAVIGTPKLGLIRSMTFEINYCCYDHTAKWPAVLREILAALPAERKLDTVKIVITDEMKQVVDESNYGDHWEGGVLQLLEPLNAWKGIKRVEFSGDLLGDYCEMLEKTMTANGEKKAVEEVV
ncbi:MAG: hypothetical protein FRX48_09761 [Lasallia pustulata]|uniref:Uncharacterized protein n=1 Tax=Lasallia pustulata TaxID=136370 RepID=A0A5M8PC16_9LECA|nr:MAG: hypothetical protein FRX48_09761 [Lasallia pustulata]